MASATTRSAFQRNDQAIKEAQERGRNEPPKVQPKHAREEVGPPKQAQTKKQDGAEQLRETINRREYKPGPEHFRPDGGGYSGPTRTPSPPRYGDANFKDPALTKARQDQAQQQAQKQEQRQEPPKQQR